jgi:hypothetical protein
VYASVVATIDESMFATHSLERVLYRAGSMKAPTLKSRVPVYHFLLHGFKSASRRRSSSVTAWDVAEAVSIVVSSFGSMV